MVVRKWSFSIKIVAVVCLFVIVTGQRRNFSQQQRVQQNNLLRQRQLQNARQSLNNQRQFQNTQVARNNLQLQGRNNNLQIQNRGRSLNNQQSQSLVRNGRSSINNRQMQLQNGGISRNNQQLRGRHQNVGGFRNNQQTRSQIQKGRSLQNSQRLLSQSQHQNSQRTPDRFQNDRGLRNNPIMQGQIQKSARSLQSQQMQNLIKNNDGSVRNLQMQNQLHSSNMMNNHQSRDMAQRLRQKLSTAERKLQQNQNRNKFQNDQLLREARKSFHTNPRESLHNLQRNDPRLTRENINRIRESNPGAVRNIQDKIPLDIHDAFNGHATQIQNQNSIRLEHELINDPISQRNALLRNQRLGNFEPTHNTFREFHARQDFPEQHLHQKGGHLRHTPTDVLAINPQAGNAPIRDILSHERDLGVQARPLGRDANHGLYQEKSIINPHPHLSEAGLIDPAAAFGNPHDQLLEPVGGRRLDPVMVPDATNHPVDRFLEPNNPVHKIPEAQSREARLLLDPSMGIDRPMASHAGSSNMDHLVSENRIINSHVPDTQLRSRRLSIEAGQRALAGEALIGNARLEHLDPQASSLDHGHLDRMGALQQDGRPQEISKTRVAINVDAPQINHGFRSRHDIDRHVNVVKPDLSNPINTDVHINNGQTPSPNDLFHDQPIASQRILEHSRLLLSHLEKLQSSIKTMGQEGIGPGVSARKDLRQHDLLLADPINSRGTADIAAPEHRPIHAFDKTKIEAKRPHSARIKDVFPPPQDSFAGLRTSQAPPPFAKNLHDPQSQQPVPPSSRGHDQHHQRQESRNTDSLRAMNPQSPSDVHQRGGQQSLPDVHQRGGQQSLPDVHQRGGQQSLPDVHQRGGQQYPHEPSRPLGAVPHEARRHPHIDAHRERFPATDHLTPSLPMERHQPLRHDPHFRDYPPSRDPRLSDRYGRYRDPAPRHMEHALYNHPSGHGQSFMRDRLGGHYGAYEAYPQHGREMFNRPMHDQRRHHMNPPFVGSISNPHPPPHIRHGSPEFVNWLKTMDAMGIDTMYEMPDITDPPLPSTTMPLPPSPTVVTASPIKPLMSLKNKASGPNKKKPPTGIVDIKPSSKPIDRSQPSKNSTLPTKSQTADAFPHQAKFNAVLDYMQELLTLQKGLMVSKAANPNPSPLSGKPQQNPEANHPVIEAMASPALQDPMGSAGPGDIHPVTSAELHQQTLHYPSGNQQGPPELINDPLVHKDQTHLIDVPLTSLNQPLPAHPKTESSKMIHDPYVQLESLHTKQTHRIDVPLASLSQPGFDSPPRTQQMDVPQAKPKLSIVPSSELLQHIVGKATLPVALDTYYKKTKPLAVDPNVDASLIQRFPSRQPRSGVASDNQTVTGNRTKGKSLSQSNINEIIKDINSMRQETSLGNLRDINKIGENVIADSTEAVFDANRSTRLPAETNPQRTDPGNKYHTLYQLNQQSNFPHRSVESRGNVPNKASPKGTGQSKPYHTVFQVNKNPNVPSFSFPLVSSRAKNYPSGFGQTKNKVAHKVISFGKQPMDRYEILSNPSSQSLTTNKGIKTNFNMNSAPLVKSSVPSVHHVTPHITPRPIKIENIVWKPQTHQRKVPNSNTGLWSSKGLGTSIGLQETTPMPASSLKSTTQKAPVDLQIPKRAAPMNFDNIAAARQRLREKMEMKGIVAASTNETVPTPTESLGADVSQQSSGKGSDKPLSNANSEVKVIPTPEPSSNEEPASTEPTSEPVEAEPAGDQEAVPEEGEGEKVEKGEGNSSEYYYYYYYDD